MPLSEQQVLQLAPDAASSKAGLGLASASKWLEFYQHEKVVWGLCLGSGKEPYRTQVDLSEPAFRCSCPSRKFPCKHGLALLLLLARTPDAFSVQTPPDWVAEWLAGRNERAVKQLLKQTQADTEAAPLDNAAELAPNSASQKRAAQREAQVANGVQDAMRWLEDVVRTGLVAARSQPYTYWDTQAARLVDAKAPGLARRVRHLPQLLTSADWQDQMLAELGNLYLLLQAHANLPNLAPSVQADVRAAIGWTVEQASLLQTPGQLDNWHVLAIVQVEDEQLLTRRTWLQAHSDGQIAMLLDFSAGRINMSLPLLVGSCVPAELVFFPGSVAQRALLKAETLLEQDSAAPQFDLPTAGAGINEFLGKMGAQWTCNPWLERSAGVLLEVHVVERNQRWFVRDQSAHLLPLAKQTPIWLLQSIGGGASMHLFGEWDRQCFWPLSAWQNEQWVALPQEPR